MRLGLSKGLELDLNSAFTTYRLYDLEQIPYTLSCFTSLIHKAGIDDDIYLHHKVILRIKKVMYVK